MIIKGNNEFKKNPSELIKQDDKSDESSKLVKMDVIKANDKEVKIVDAKTSSRVKYTCIAIMLVAIFLSAVIIIAILPYSVFSSKESRIYMDDIVNDLENWRYKTIEDPDDIIEEREYIYDVIIMQDDNIYEKITVNNEPENYLQVTSLIFI